MMTMNVFRILGDVSHTLSKCILIWAIHSNKSAEGVSLITQALYGLVFVTRYLDLFWTRPAASYWNFVLKNFYIWSSLYIILLMMRVYPRSREREKAWRLGAWATAAAVVLGPVLSFGFEGWRIRPYEILRAFSLVLESVCVLPQLLLLRQTTVPTVIDSFYLVALGSYRAFYILNWIVRARDPTDRAPPSHPIAVVFGVLQTALYLDFAWVYWTRQRVKLRAGGVVDSDDLGKSWLLRGLLGRRGNSLDEERPVDGDGEARSGTRTGGPRPGAGGGRWGARGISISADDDVRETERQRQRQQRQQRPKKGPNGVSAEQQQTDDDMQGFLDDDDEDDDHEEISMDGSRPGQAQGRSDGAAGGLSGGEEWRDGSAK